MFGVAATTLLTIVALRTGGGLTIGDTTAVEIVLQITAGAAAALALLAGGARRPWGAVTIGLFGVLALLTIVSVTWSIEPSESWLEANRTLAWFGAFVIGASIARLAGDWLNALLVALLAVAVIVSAYALLTKIAPESLASDEVFARLRRPYDYWNSVGLTAALGLPACLWLVARRETHDALAALAYPATAVLVAAILLSYSRGALLAAAIGILFWLALAPHRLRAVVVLVIGASGAVLAALYAFGRDALTVDNVRVGLRADAGVDFGLVLGAMLVIVLAAGLAIEFAMARRKPSEIAYRRAGATVFAVVALAILVFLGTLAASDRGLTGSISHTWTTLTDPNAVTPSNDPGRLTEVGSIRSRYWHEALQIYGDHPWKGVGAGAYGEARLRYREDSYAVRHAHGYVVQTAADLGTFGLLASFALLLSFSLAAARTLGYVIRIPGRPRRGPPAMSPERLGLIALATIVLTFGIHSLLDWTWFVPGNAIVALLSAGWLAGRGPDPLQPFSAPALRSGVRFNASDPLRAGAATAVVLVALAVAWATWQPARSARSSDEALATLDRAAGNPKKLGAARELALRARDRNPVAVDPLFELAAIATAAGRPGEAEAWYQRAVKLQPSNADVWLRYADFELTERDDPERALRLVRPGLFLDPHSQQADALLKQIAVRTGTIYSGPPQAAPAPAPAPGA